MRPYWSVPREPEPLELSDDDAVLRVGQALEDAVAAALVADVPVGSYLSGGVDSSLIVALMRKLRGAEPIETFAAGFGDPRYDELALRAARGRAVRHRPPRGRGRPRATSTALWPLLTWHRDAPISEPADVAVFRARERRPPAR